MKNLLTKTLFISLLFSAITPAIQANEMVNPESLEVAVPVGFFSRLAAKASDLRSTLAAKAVGLKNDTA